MACPACAVYVIGFAFDGVGEDCMSGDDEPVAFEAVRGRDVSA